MLRRIVSLGPQAPGSGLGLDPMSPTSNDAGRSSDSKGPGGLASVFKGLTGGAKLTKVPSPGSGQPATLPAASPPPHTATMAAAAFSTSSIASTQAPSETTDGDSIHNQPRRLFTRYAECLEQLRNGTLNERVTAAQTLRSILAEYPIDPVFDVWHAAKDLIEPSKGRAARQAGWELLAECTKQGSSAHLERREFFQTITATADPSDFHLQLAALIDLTNTGRNLSGFDYDVFPLLTEWFQLAYKASKVATKKPTSAERTAGGGSSSSGGGKSSKSKGAQTSEELNLSQLFAFTIEIVKHSFKIASDSAMEGLLNAVLDIAMNTSTEEDLSSCIAVIKTCVTVGAMPSRSLDRCVMVLSSIYCLVAQLQRLAWEVLANIFKSHHGLHTIRILLDTLRKHPLENSTTKDASREVRGALAVLQKLVRKAGSNDYPSLPYALLVDGLRTVAERTQSPKVVATILQLINQLFDNGDALLSPLLLDEDWASILSVAAICAKRSTPSTTYDGAAARRLLFSSPVNPEDASQVAVNRESAILTARIEALLRGLLIERPEYTQHSTCINFLADVHPILPDSGAELVLKYFAEFCCCFPSDPNWDANLRLVLDAFYANQARSAIIRLRALQTATEVQGVLELIDGAIDAPDAVADLTRRILARAGEERDTVLLVHAISFAVSIAASVDDALFSFIIQSLASVVKNDDRRQALDPSASASTPASPLSPGKRPDAFVDQSTSNIAARGYVQIFMSTMNSDATKAAIAFKALVSLARDQRCPIDARLSAMKMLFRLRADWANRIFLVSQTESEGLAAVLFRTEASLERKMADEMSQENLASQARNDAGASSPPPQSQNPTRAARGVSFSQGAAGPSRTASGPRHRISTGHYRQLWSLPDSEALPLLPLANASTVLFSHQWDESMIGSNDGDSEEKTMGDTSHITASGLAASTMRKTGEKAAEDDFQAEARPAMLILDMAAWMEVVLELLTKGVDWELYSFVLVHLPSQLSNHAVCRGAVPVILRIRAALCDQMRLNCSQEPPASTGLRRSDVQSCVLQILTMNLSYHEYFQRQEGDDLVRTFIKGLTDTNPIACVHALSICCYELPHATGKSLVTILQWMSQIITRPGVAVHILELLACLSRLPWLYSNFREDEYRIAFGVCFRYLQGVRDGRISSRTSHSSANDQSTGASGYGMGAYEHHGPELPGQAQPLQPNVSNDLPQYVYALAYHVLTFWFLALRVGDRASYVSWIASRLFINNDGRQITDEQALITLDFMQRVAFSDADESAPVDDADDSDAGAGGSETAPVMRSWLIGNSIITIEHPPGKPGLARITKRQPSGTSYYTVQENLKPPPPHQTRSLVDAMEGISGQPLHSQASASVFPSHLLAQLLAPVPQPFDSPLRPIPLPNDDAVERAFRAFDRNSTVDGHKVGVIYIGEGQTEEAEILANVSGSSDYIEFLNGLGTLVRLKGATFNTQGLNRQDDSDGAYTFCWRDRVTEMVFHVTTQMPTDKERDPRCINKKRHIGNDYVNIIFNDSALPFRFDTFPSEFNFVNIVITPESRASFVARRELSLQKQREEERDALVQEQLQPLQADQQTPAGGAPPIKRRPMPFYKVQVMSRPGFPEISPSARTKIISLKALPDFIRLIALNASVFSQVWANRQGGEHVSSWRNRLRQINRLRERYGASAHPSMAPSPPPASTQAGGASGAGGVGGAGAGGAIIGSGITSSVIGGSGGATAGGGMSVGGVPGGGGGGAMGGSGGVGGSGPSLGGGGSSEHLSRPSVGAMRDSFNSLRRTSMATFFTAAGEPNNNSSSNISGSASNQRSSVHSAVTTMTGATTTSDNTESTAVNGGTELWVDSLDFSRWT